MATAIIGLVGALLGALVALLGAALSERRQARYEELRWRRDQRATAYAEALRHLVHARRITQGDWATERRLYEDPDWNDNLVEAQLWMWMLSMRCSPDKRRP